MSFTRWVFLGATLGVSPEVVSLLATVGHYASGAESGSAGRCNTHLHIQVSVSGTSSVSPRCWLWLGVAAWWLG